MREGFTTGSCATAAALASCLWRRDGKCPSHVEIIVPEGRSFMPEIIPRGAFTCGVIKDSGDDPDITNDCEVRASVEIDATDGEIVFRAGEGVGVITRAGLKLPIGEAAINPVPRQMIEQAVRSVCGSRSATVTVSIENGEALAQRTFNPRLGIAGGLSVLGTSGIVRPMSEEALTETIALELSVIRQSSDAVALTFGNQGEEAVHGLFPGLPCAQMSNFVGFALDETARLGFTRALIAGHPGKLSKVAAGAMQTHSRYGDARRESILAHLALMGAGRELAARVYVCNTTDAAIGVLKQTPFAAVWDMMADSAMRYCEARIMGAIDIDALFLDGAGQVLGRSERIRKDSQRWKNG